MRKNVILGTAFMAVALFTGAEAQSVRQDGCVLSLFYPNNGTELTAVQRDAVAQFIRSTRGTVRVIGYASNAGQAAANQALSDGRARGVAADVQAADPSRRIELVRGLGEAGDGAQNRRADVFRGRCARVPLNTAAGAAGVAGAAGAAGAGIGTGVAGLGLGTGLGAAGAAAAASFVVLGVVAGLSGDGDGSTTSTTGQ